MKEESEREKNIGMLKKNSCDNANIEHYISMNGIYP
jgi:hypothetical protein